MSNLLSQASLVMIPSGYKEDVVYSQIPTSGAGDLSFTRASNGTRINSAGLVEVCPWNLLLNTDTFSSWNLEGGTLTSGFTAPDGSSTAYKYVQIPGGGLYSGSGGVTADVKFAQVWIKSVSGGSITVDLSDGAAYFGTFNVTGEWQLFTALYTANSRIGLYLYGISNASGIYVWHPQVNIGSTAKPYFPTTDRLNVPRLTYQNGGGGCPSLLLEKQSTNLIAYSNADAGMAFNGTLTLNATTSPEGVSNGFSFLVNANANGGLSFITLTTSAQSYTFSAYLKGTVNGQKVRLLGDLNGTIETFTLTTDWVRYTKTFTGAVGAQSIYLLNGAYFSPSENNLYYAYGMQLEASSYATSLIPTSGSSATRVADECKKSGIGALIGGTSGTVFFDIKTNPILSSSNYKQFCYYVTSGGSQSYLYLDGANKITTNATWGSLFYNTALQPNTRYKVALVFAPNDFALYINGVSVATASSGTPNNNVDLQIGQFNGTEMCEFVFNQYTHFPSRLTNAELASLTTI